MQTEIGVNQLSINDFSSIESKNKMLLNNKDRYSQTNQLFDDD